MFPFREAIRILLRLMPLLFHSIGCSMHGQLLERAIKKDIIISSVVLNVVRVSETVPGFRNSDLIQNYRANSSTFSNPPTPTKSRAGVCKTLCTQLSDSKLLDSNTACP